MDNMKRNYMMVTYFQEELIGENRESFIFFGDNYEFWKYTECYGPTLGQIVQKCPKIEYDEKVVKGLEIYIKQTKCLFVLSNTTKSVFVVSIELL